MCPRALVGVIGCSLWGIVAALSSLSAALGAAPPTLDEVVRGLARTRSLFLEQPQSFRLVHAREKSEVLAEGGGLLTFEVVLARKQDKWYLQRRFLQPGDYAGVTVSAEPLFNVVSAKRVLENERDNSTCVVQNFEDGRNSYLFWYYFEYLGLNVYRYVAASGGADYEKLRKEARNESTLGHPFLPDSIEENRAKYQVQAEQESVDGVPCWVVLWPGMDRIWLDPEHGFALRRRAYHWAPGKPMRQEVFNKDFREVRPGLWLPFAQVVERYGNLRTGAQSTWGKPVSRSFYALREIEFDKVKDDLFDVRVPAGTRVTDLIRQIQYTVPEEGADPFAGPLADAQDRLSRSRYRALFVIGGALVLLVIVLLALSRSRGSREKPATGA